jgi:tRNA U54 and U55 pseudouridine synthase Pus10
MNRDDALVQMRRASSFRTICEVHREIFDGCEELPEPIKTKLQDLVIEAFVMGKKIDAKLREYRADWDAGFYGLNTDRRADRAKRNA